MVDTLAEQERLERLLDREQAARARRSAVDLHYLLSTPFRYGAPYPRGSRFRRAGITPACSTRRSPGDDGGGRDGVRAPAASSRSRRRRRGRPTPASTRPSRCASAPARPRPHVAAVRPRRARWTDPTDYAAVPGPGGCGARAAASRRSAIGRRATARAASTSRCSRARRSASRAPLERQTWRLHLDRGGVRALCEFPEHRLAFDRTAFADDPADCDDQLGAMNSCV